jgi:hypothetical protein
MGAITQTRNRKQKALRKMEIILVSLGLFAIAVCTTASANPQYTDADYGPLPANYREMAKAYVKQNLRDPYTAHIRVSDEKPEKAEGIASNFQHVPAYRVKVYVYAKKAHGGYTSEHLMIVYIWHGKAVNVFDLSHR